MLTIFRKMFGSFSAPHIVRQNNFDNFQHYFLQKTIPVAMAGTFCTAILSSISLHSTQNINFSTGLRNQHGICPPEVIRFLLDLFKYNDNSKNHYSDNYYRASLIDALTATITPVISVVHQVSLRLWSRSIYYMYYLLLVYLCGNCFRVLPLRQNHYQPTLA